MCISEIPISSIKIVFDRRSDLSDVNNALFSKNTLRGRIVLVAVLCPCRRFLQAQEAKRGAKRRIQVDKRSG
ncbi:MAG: hypothetical protein ACI8ZB_005410 [Desulforhopalus sp.]|jgi:hypothetical protein